VPTSPDSNQQERSKAEPETRRDPEHWEPALETGRGGVLGEGEDVVPTRRLSVDEPISAPVLTQTEDLLVE